MAIKSYHLTAAVALIVASYLIEPDRAFANDDDFAQCTSDNLDEMISGCTSIVQDASVSAKNRAVAFNNRGNAYRRQSEYQQAIADYTESIRLNPRYALARFGRSIAYFEQSRLTEAKSDLDCAIRINPK